MSSRFNSLHSAAKWVLTQPALSEKLSPWPRTLPDDDPGPPLRITTPARPDNLQFAARKQSPPMPKPQAFQQAEKRALAHHIMANHELQAVEVMAWTLLAFPEAPAEFRRGIAEILQEEQRHTGWHAERAAELGLPFGSVPVNCYIWKQTSSWQTLLDYVACLPLVFEARNLDHSLELADAFEKADDPVGAGIMQAIHQDEIRHVAFGWRWLSQLKPAALSEWEAFREHLHLPLQPAKARGNVFQTAARRAAGLSDEFIQHVASEGVPHVDAH